MRISEKVFTHLRKVILLPILVVFIVSCGSESSSLPTYEAEIWIGSHEIDEELSVDDIQREIKAKLEVLNLIASDSFKDFSGFNIENKESTSTFVISVNSTDSTEVIEALTAYIDIVQGAYNVRVIQEPHIKK